LAPQFENFAECCLELARVAETPARRARFILMAREYRRAKRQVSESMRLAEMGGTNRDSAS